MHVKRVDETGRGFVAFNLFAEDMPGMQAHCIFQFLCLGVGELRRVHVLVLVAESPAKY